MWKNNEAGHGRCPCRPLFNNKAVFLLNKKFMEADLLQVEYRAVLLLYLQRLYFF